MTDIKERMKIRPEDIALVDDRFCGCFGNCEMEEAVFSMVAFWRQFSAFAPVPVNKVYGGRHGKGVQFLQMRGLLEVLGDLVFPTRELIVRALRARPSEAGRLKLTLIDGGQPLEQLLPGSWAKGKLNPDYHVYP